MEKLQRIRVGVLSGLLLMTILVWLPALATSSTQTDFLQVRFLDVGQGDAIHVITPDGYEALIDGGLTSGVLRELSVGRNWLDRSIDVVIATHPDADHIGGLVDVLQRYHVDLILQTDNEHDTPITAAFADAVEAEQAQVVIAQAGQQLMLGASTTLTFLAPSGSTAHWPSNAASIMLLITYGDIDFLLTGDAPSGSEEYVAEKYGSALQSEVLKLGHHGSDTSSSAVFLDVVQPEFAVVSAEKDNRYGHPHQAVIDRVQSRGIEILSTAESGTISFVSDGVTVWVE